MIGVVSPSLISVYLPVLTNDLFESCFMISYSYVTFLVEKGTGI